MSDTPLIAARRSLCRKVGAALAAAMAETDTSFEQMTERLGWSPGIARSSLLTLLNGRPISLERMAEMMSAMGVYLRLELRHEDNAP